MKIDAKELERLAAAQPRVDLYTGIHKALRACMADALLALGRCDPDDPQDLAAATERVLNLLDLCESHLQHENDFVVQALAQAAGGTRAVLAQQLYRQLALFVAENFRHMDVEETAHNAVLWARYTDAELIELHDALVASIPPGEMMRYVRWLVPFMNPAERLALTTDMRAKAPAPAFAAVLDCTRPHLTAGEWAKLARGLGLPAVPGLVAA